MAAVPFDPIDLYVFKWCSRLLFHFGLEENGKANGKAKKSNQKRTPGINAKQICLLIGGILL